MMEDNLVQYICGIADNSLILGQRIGELTGHGPSLETDIVLLQKLQSSTDETLAAIAVKSIKEVSYHKRFSSAWVRRLGDGTFESRGKMQTAIDDLWVYTDELFHMTDADIAITESGAGVDVRLLKEQYYKNVSAILEECTLEVPKIEYFQKGGKIGIHTEHMGFILSDMQYMQRTFPNMTW